MQIQSDGTTLVLVPDTQEEAITVATIHSAIMAQGHLPLMATKPAHPRSSHWSTVRAHWLKDNDKCMACNGTEFLEVHHIKPFHLHPDLELDPHNFITLCEKPGRNCHHTWGHFYDWHKFNPHVVDMVKIWNEAVKRAA